MSDQTDLEKKRSMLRKRLDDGYERIDSAVASGADVEAWETFWIDLFREYEKVCDELMGTRLQEDATIVPVGGSDRRRT